MAQWKPWGDHPMVVVVVVVSSVISAISALAVLVPDFFAHRRADTGAAGEQHPADVVRAPPATADRGATPDPAPMRPRDRVRAQGGSTEGGLTGVEPGADIAWVTIPGGTFQMGSEDGVSDEKPMRSVRVPTFALSKTEVTVGQYRQFVEKTGHAAPTSCDWGAPNWGEQGRENHPINCVSWVDASAFAKWAGGRLPSEAEWEYAARSGGKNQTYAWGNSEPSSSLAVYSASSTAPVCSKAGGNTAQGLCDMAGNVWEWVEDWYGPYGEAPTDGRARTQAARRRVLRGGGWDNDASDLRAANRGRNVSGYRFVILGFRVASSAP